MTATKAQRTQRLPRHWDDDEGGRLDLWTTHASSNNISSSNRHISSSYNNKNNNNRWDVFVAAPHRSWFFLLLDVHHHQTAAAAAAATAFAIHINNIHLYTHTHTHTNTNTHTLATSLWWSWGKVDLRLILSLNAARNDVAAAVASCMTAASQPASQAALIEICLGLMLQQHVVSRCRCRWLPVFATHFLNNKKKKKKSSQFAHTQLFPFPRAECGQAGRPWGGCCKWQHASGKWQVASLRTSSYS